MRFCFHRGKRRCWHVINHFKCLCLIFHRALCVFPCILCVSIVLLFDFKVLRSLVSYLNSFSGLDWFRRSVTNFMWVCIASVSHLVWYWGSKKVTIFATRQASFIYNFVHRTYKKLNLTWIITFITIYVWTKLYLNKSIFFIEMNLAYCLNFTRWWYKYEMRIKLKGLSMVSFIWTKVGSAHVWNVSTSSKKYIIPTLNNKSQVKILLFETNCSL